MGVISSIFYFVVVLGILVFVHEFGHFLMARLSGMRVEVFALGMGFRLFGWNKVTGFTFGNLPENLELEDNTDYRVAAFPIGGYCKISGMIDETLDTEAIAQEPKEYEFRSKNAFKKAITISGGVLFNVILAIIIFAILAFNIGETTYKTNEIAYVAPNSIGETIGLKANDKVKKIDGVRIVTWNNLLEELAIENLGENKQVLVARNNIDTLINVNGKKLIDMIASNKAIGLEPKGLRTVIFAVQPNSLAEEAGIKNNDTIVAVNNTPIFSFHEFVDFMQANKGKEVSIEWKSNANTINRNIQLDASGIIGVQISQVYTGDILRTEFGVFEAIWKGTTQAFETLATILSSIKQIIVGNIEFKKAIGGPIMIAQQATQFADRGVLSFLSFTAMLSLSLALINILPLPALDGGHLIIIIVEAIMRREISVKVKLGIQQVGIFLLLGLMFYVIVNDVLKLM